MATNRRSPGQFIVSLSQAVSVGTTASYTVSGTATAGSDYTALSGSVTIPAGQTSATIAVPVIDDTLSEPNETVIVSLTGISAGAPNAVVGSAMSATITIGDDEMAPPQTVTMEAEAADTIINYRSESIGVASGGKVLSFVGGAGGESGSAAFVFGNSPDEIIGTYNIIIGTFDESDGLASFTVGLTDFETGIKTEIGRWDLNTNLGSSLANATTYITPIVATNIGLTTGDIITVNGFENGGDHARLDYLQLVPSF